MVFFRSILRGSNKGKKTPFPFIGAFARSSNQVKQKVRAINSFGIIDFITLKKNYIFEYPIDKKVILLYNN